MNNKKGVPANPVLLAAFLGNLIEGDNKHQQDGPLPKETRARLDAAKSKIDLLNSSVLLSKGQYRTSSQDRREFVKSGEAEMLRDAVYAEVGHKDQILVDYGLAVRRKAHRGTTDGVKPAEAPKAERARVRLAKEKAQLERVNARKSALEARIARQEAEVAKAAPVTPPEPQPVTETPPVTEPPAPHSSQGEGGTTPPEKPTT